MKNLVQFLNEANKNARAKKVLKLTLSGKFKISDTSLKKKLDNALAKLNKTKPIKEGKDDIPEDVKSEIVNTVCNFAENLMWDWAHSWDEPEDMHRDLDTLYDWFWQDFLDENLSDIYDELEHEDADGKEIFSEDDLHEYLEEISDDIDSRLETVADEIKEWKCEREGWSDDEDDDDDDDDDWGDDDDDDNN